MRCIKKLQLEGGYLVFINDTSNESELMKNFGIGAQILKKLNVREFKLISTNKREYAALNGFDLRLIETIDV